MKVRMIATRRGCEDGFTVKLYEENQEYEMRNSLANAFFAAGFAVPIEREGKKARHIPKLRPWKRTTLKHNEKNKKYNAALSLLKLPSIRKPSHEQ